LSKLTFLFALQRSVTLPLYRAMEAKPKVVLVAEDEALIRMEAAEVLTEAGFSVVEAIHAEEALSVLRSRHAEICVLFTDIHARQHGWGGASSPCAATLAVERAAGGLG
jgi:AmiR/NasT family two-component response regulator